MNQNLSRIRAGLESLTATSPLIVSGTVVAGSVNTSANTCDVLPSAGPVIRDVLLTAISDSANGIVCYPKESSDVIAGCVDGAGRWVLLAASEFDSYIINADETQLKVTETGIELKKGTTTIDVSTLVKIAASSESLHAILTDLVSAIAALTVGTSGGPSSVPVNVASFTALIPRINNLLSP